MRCESCELLIATVSENCDNSQVPYMLCSGCHSRLTQRCLRPAEWYNLAKRHGWPQFLLHDDFYDEDGVATQPEIEVVEAEEYPAPHYSEVRSDASKLLDYSITRWHLDDVIKKAWRLIPRNESLKAISEKYARFRNLHIRNDCLVAAAMSLGDLGADFVRFCWDDTPRADFSCLVQASAACLPFREGFDRAASIVSRSPDRERREMAFALSYYHSEETLGWIEENICEPYTESWGNIAAASRLDWTRIIAWLSRGRPLSLVAIDALKAIARPDTPFLKNYQPELWNRPDISSFEKLLKDYMARDPVPRVQQRIAFILENKQKITQK